MFLAVSIWMSRQQTRRTHGTAFYLNSLVKFYLIRGFSPESEQQKISDVRVAKLISYTNFRPFFCKTGV
jgi:hypothetical protein